VDSNLVLLTHLVLLEFGQVHIRLIIIQDVYHSCHHAIYIFRMRILFLHFFSFYCLVRSQHMRPFRPSLPPPTSPEYRLYDLNKRLSMRTEVLIKEFHFFFQIKKKNIFRNVIISGGIHLSMNFLKKMQH
jgi:hypothetical protein